MPLAYASKTLVGYLQSAALVIIKGKFSDLVIINKTVNTEIRIFSYQFATCLNLHLGHISASGGDGHRHYGHYGGHYRYIKGGGGGGGRIALQYKTGHIGGDIRTYGGSGMERGAAGTISLVEENSNKVTTVH